jgi:predicted PurR-regulated permease PerM
MVAERRRRTPAGPTHQRSVPRALELAAAISWRLLVCAGAIAVIAIVVARLRLVVLPLVVALLLATALAPLVMQLRRRNVPPAAAAAIVLTGAVGAIAGAVAVVAVPAWGELDELDINVRGGVERLAEWFGLSEHQVDATIERALNQLREHADSIAGGIISGGVLALELVAGSMLALVLLFFVLKDGERIWLATVGLLPAERRPAVDATGNRIWFALGGYLRGIATVALVDAVCIGLGLYLIGIPLVLPLAVLTFLGGFVPYVGATATGLAAVLVALVSEGTVAALLVVALVLVVQQLEGHLLQPLIVGRSVQLHPVAVLLAVAVGGVVWGIPGAFVAVPLTLTLVATADAFRASPATHGERDGGRR